MTPDRKISQIEFERIERYLLGEMMAKEKHSFEVDMKNDLILQKAVEENRIIIKAIETGGFRENLKSIHKDKFGSPQKSGLLIRWLAIAAGMAIFVTVGIWALDFGSAEDRIFAEYTTMDPGLPVPMSSTTANTYSFHDAMVDYKANKFDSAIQKWSALLIEEPESNVLNYYIGSSYFNLEEYAQAVPFFATAATHETGEFSAKAQWYLILSQLKLKEKDSVLDAKPLPDSPYNDQIKEVQDKLRK